MLICPTDDVNWKDIVYNKSSGLWNCCQKFNAESDDCTDPGNETFYAPAPGDLKALLVFSMLSNASLSSTTTSLDLSQTLIAVSSATLSNLSPPTSITSSNLSTSTSSISSYFSPAVKIGVSFGAILSGCAILTGSFFMVMFWRSKGLVWHQKTTPQSINEQGGRGQGTDINPVRQSWVSQPAEVNGESAITDVSILEMPAVTAITNVPICEMPESES